MWKKKNDDYSQFPENSENHTYNEEGAKERKKRKNKDYLSEIEQKESDRDSSDQEIKDDGLEEKNEDNISQKFRVTFRERVQISASGHTDADLLGTDFFQLL